MLNGCEKPECPDGMHRVTVGDKSICVPDDLGREWYCYFIKITVSTLRCP